jgi:hypothetical protein
VTLPEGLGTLALPTAVVERAAPPRVESGPQDSDPVAWPTLALRPDYEVNMTAEQYQALAAWQRDNEMPERAAKLGPQPPADPQLDKALDLLRAALKPAKAQ